MSDSNTDAQLIADCRRFAATNLESWYRATVSSDDDSKFDNELMGKIIATPATTFDAMKAKALALSTRAFDVYDSADNKENDDITILRSLLHDMVGEERRAMLADLTVKYGPLPPHYDTEGVFLGFSEEKHEQHLAEREQSQLERMAESGLLRTLPPEVLEIARRATPQEFEVWVRMGENLAKGMDFAEADRVFNAELAAIRAG